MQLLQEYETDNKYLQGVNLILIKKQRPIRTRNEKIRQKYASYFIDDWIIFFLPSQISFPLYHTFELCACLSDCIINNQVYMYLYKDNFTYEYNRIDYKKILSINTNCEFQKVNELWFADPTWLFTIFLNTF